MINYEASAIGSAASTFISRVHIQACGHTPEEVKADAERQCLELNAIDMRAVGIKNYKPHWAAVFGGDGLDGCAFLDDIIEPSTSKKNWFMRLFEK